MTLRILHTADWQLGTPFSWAGSDLGAHLRAQRFETVATLAALAQRKQVDAVLVAGDVFDDNSVSDKTLRLGMNALAAYSGPWILLPGNHDAAGSQSVWPRLLKLNIVPEQVILATRAEPIMLCNKRLCVLPAPLKRRHELRDLTAYMDAEDTPPHVLRVGLAHGSVQERLPEEADAVNPIAADRADKARLDYLALGDWHGTMKIGARTWYAGTPEPDRFKDNDPGNVLLVELPGPGMEPQIEKLTVGNYRWRKMELELAEEKGAEMLDARLEETFSPAKRPNTLLRLTIQGTSDFAERHHLDDVLEKWQSRLCHLQQNEEQLCSRPSQQDIATMAATGFVLDAMETLRRLQDSPEHPDHVHATLALRILYREQLKLQDSGY